MEYMTVHQLARRAGVRTLTAYNWIWDELILAYKKEGRWQIPAEEAERFLRKRDGMGTRYGDGE